MFQSFKDFLDINQVYHIPQEPSLQNAVPARPGSRGNPMISLHLQRLRTVQSGSIPAGVPQEPAGI